MVMRPDPRAGALTRVGPPRMGPWWLWAIVVILAGTAGYAGLRVGASTQLLKDTDAAVLALAADKKRLEADL